jgi:nucleoid DNA-binding protein
MNREELVQEVAKITKFKKSKIDMIITNMFDVIEKTANKGLQVRLSQFGIFEKRYRCSRIFRDMHTHETSRLPGKYVAHFKPGKRFKELVNS